MLSEYIVTCNLLVSFDRITIMLLLHLQPHLLRPCRLPVSLHSSLTDTVGTSRQWPHWHRGCGPANTEVTTTSLPAASPTGRIVSVYGNGGRSGCDVSGVACPDVGATWGWTWQACYSQPDGSSGAGGDDSVTRCICLFQHDDGYMICCDNCR